MSLEQVKKPLEYTNADRNSSLLVVFQDFRSLRGGAETLQDIEENPGMISGLKIKPVVILRILHTLQKIANHSALGVKRGQRLDLEKVHESDGMNDARLDDDDDDDDGGGKRRGKKKTKKPLPLYMPDEQESYFTDIDGKYKPRIRQYTEVVRNLHGQKLGWMHFFHAIDSNFSFNRALETLFFIERRKSMGYRPPTVRNKTHLETIAPYYKKKTDWVTHAISEYLYDPFYATTKAESAIGLHLGDPDNAATCHKVFTLENAVKWINFCYPAVQWTVERYYGAPINEDVSEDDMIAAPLTTTSPVMSTVTTPTPSVATAASGGAASGGGASGEASGGASPNPEDEIVFEKTTMRYNIYTKGEVEDDEDEEEELFGEELKKEKKKKLLEKKKLEEQAITEMILDLSDDDEEDMSLKEYSQSSEAGEEKKKSEKEEEKKPTKKKYKLLTITRPLHFINGACRIHIQEQDPNLFFRLPLAVFDTFTEQLTDSERREKLRERREALMSDGKRKSATQYLKEEIAKKRKVLTKEEFTLWIRSSDVEHLFESAMCTDEKCTGSRIAHNWLSQQKQKAVMNNRPLSFVKPFNRLFDKRMTFLANVMARDLALCEVLIGMTYLHAELMMAMKTTLLSCDIHCDNDSRTNLLFTGTHAAGKSHLLKTIEQLSMPGLSEFMSHVSQNGFTTQVNNNGLVRFMDELLASFTDKDAQTGLGILKELLTKGVLHSTMCQINPDTRQRETITTVSYWLTLFFAATNEAIYSIPKPLVSRFAPFPVAHIERTDKDPSLTNFKMRAMGKSSEIKQDYIDEWHFRQFIASCVFKWIELEVLAYPDTTIVQSMVPVVKECLDRHGYPTNTRDTDRVMFRPSIQNAITEGTSQVFHTEKHFEAGTEFHFWHVLEMYDYLLCTREHFWVGLGEMFPTLVNPVVDKVLVAFWSLVDSQQEEDRHPYKMMRGTKVTDYDYYLLDVSRAHASMDGIYRAAVELLSSEIRSVLGETVSEQNIMDILKWLDRGKFPSAVKYHGPEDEDYVKRKRGKKKITEKIDIMYEKKGGGASTYGIQISREFLRSKVSARTGRMRPEQSVEGLLKECIALTKPMVTEEGDGMDKTIVYGFSMREGKCTSETFQPQVYKTLDLSKVKGRMPNTHEALLHMENDPYYGFFFGDETNIVTQDQATERAIAKLGIDKTKTVDYHARKTWKENDFRASTLPKVVGEETVKVVYNGVYPPPKRSKAAIEQEEKEEREAMEEMEAAKKAKKGEEEEELEAGRPSKKPKLADDAISYLEANKTPRDTVVDAMVQEVVTNSNNQKRNRTPSVAPPPPVIENLFEQEDIV